MTISETKEYLLLLLGEKTTKRESKVYNRFLKVIMALEKRDFSKEEIEMIESELTRLDLRKQPRKRKTYLRKKLRSFLEFINNNFSLIIKEHYANYGMSLGIVFGVALGTAIFNDSNGSSVGICIGLFVGYIIGMYMDKEAEKENRVLNLV